ncbi:transcription termination factor Rho, partial [bacterium]|nr:transcription termination factor Rho [bacterium]
NGGSVTVLATALVQTGSRMDDYIFEEFKGTGNSEIVLNRTLSDMRIFPSIDILASGTRRDELMYQEAEIAWIHALRRQLAAMKPDAAMLALLQLMETYPDNETMMRTGPGLF